MKLSTLHSDYRRKRRRPFEAFRSDSSCSHIPTDDPLSFSATHRQKNSNAMSQEHCRNRRSISMRAFKPPTIAKKETKWASFSISNHIANIGMRF
jgi:hypothetical protein